jgi:hypothetical protein
VTDSFDKVSDKGRFTRLWDKLYLASRESLKREIVRKRDLVRVPVTLPDGSRLRSRPVDESTP